MTACRRIGARHRRAMLPLAIAASLSLGGCSLSRQMLYSPRSTPPASVSWVQAPPEAITVRTDDGLDLAGYYWPGAPADPDIYVFFHGRNWNALRAAEAAQYLAGAGNAVLVASYRGFRGNPGHLSEAGMTRDAAAFIARARAMAGPNARVWLVGHSIGSAVALRAGAADGHVAGIIAMSAFTSVTDALPRFWRSFVPDRWDNLAALKALTVPVVIIEGSLDPIIPLGSGDDLFSAYGHSSSLVTGENSRHNPDMRILAPWINQAIDAMQNGSLAALPFPPTGWVEKVRRP
ncbi:alpha/beta hydrolase [Sphingobium nicotianae]|uniref:Alpha/beta fold hydrolase n=1 Tax=Sphingobium nicotianae TaxID=2782607 RepID=A0A9X1IRQ5_9SPHN|nr:alpha/beta fold hydrolase [Sphingobium nicotianae]MBT2187529.1 alpha/beta fold hydrolase [Sphingobium nicotianae]